MRKKLLNAGLHALLGLLCLLWLTPFVLLVLQSFRGESGGQVAYVLPKVWTLGNYRFLFQAESGFLRWYMNTLTIALFCAVLQTLLVLSVAYAFSRLRFRGRRLMMNFSLVLGMFPGFLTMIVLYYLLKLLGLTQGGAVPGLILIYTASSGLGYYIA